MKISTRGRYALRLMLDLALYGQEEPVRLRDVAKRQEISVKYLEQIISTLQKAGDVRSVRGAQGGYLLARSPEQYTVGMILRRIEGDLAPVSCLAGEVNECPRQGYCVTLRLWKELDEAIQGVVDRYTLADLVEWSHGMASDFVI